jgi:hypothetical protein
MFHISPSCALPSCTIQSSLQFLCPLVLFRACSSAQARSRLSQALPGSLRIHFHTPARLNSNLLLKLHFDIVVLQ